MQQPLRNSFRVYVYRCNYRWWVDFDPNGFIDKTLQFEQPLDALTAQAKNDPAMLTAHNFIFGSQENVSAITLSEWTLHDERADQDYASTYLIFT